uniref:Uncharacterized protein n=1 Tax=Glossina brevipalpis TaxID=37001 RepID=A0A1A9W412_9MUSC
MVLRRYHFISLVVPCLQQNQFHKQHKHQYHHHHHHRHGQLDNKGKTGLLCHMKKDRNQFLVNIGKLVGL